MTRVVSVFNGVSASLPPGVGAPNVLGWPAPAACAIPATFSTLPPGFGVVTASGAGTPTALLPQPVPGLVPPRGNVPGITPLLAPTSTAPPGGNGNAPLASAMVAPPSIGTYQPTPSRLPAGQSISRFAPPGAIDTDADDEAVPTLQRPGTPADSSRGRSHTTGLTWDVRNARSRIHSTEAGDDNDGYAVNRERRETTCMTIPLKTFSQPATAPLGGCGNQTLSSEMSKASSIYHQSALWPKTLSQPATAPPGGCCNQTLSSSSYICLQSDNASRQLRKPVSNSKFTGETSTINNLSGSCSLLGLRRNILS